MTECSPYFIDWMNHLQAVDYAKETARQVLRHKSADNDPATKDLYVWTERIMRDCEKLVERQKARAKRMGDSIEDDFDIAGMALHRMLILAREAAGDGGTLIGLIETLSGLTQEQRNRAYPLFAKAIKTVTKER